MTRKNMQDLKDAVAENERLANEVYDVSRKLVWRIDQLNVANARIEELEAELARVIDDAATLSDNLRDELAGLSRARQRAAILDRQREAACDLVEVERQRAEVAEARIAELEAVLLVAKKVGS